MNNNITLAFQSELSQVLTEYLFGATIDLPQLDFNDPRIKYFVDRRIRKNKSKEPPFAAEQKLFNAFWPPTEGKQLIQIVGDSGTGKSTFLRYFFQYYLPYYEIIKNKVPQDSEIDRIHRDSYKKHIVLYVDLRQPTSHLKKFLFRSLGESLHYTCKNLGCENLLNQGEKKYSEKHVMDDISRIAALCESGERKYYISWFLDNSDQMPEKMQLELVKVVRKYIPKEQSYIFAGDPVKENQLRQLWRVIIPIRPETRTNLNPSWAPLQNKCSINLNPIDPDLLIEKRATFLHSKISGSKRHFNQDYYDLTHTRADFDLKTPVEIANDLKEVLLAANRLEKEKATTVSSARAVLDNLVGGSARRRLNLLPRIALSRVFRERYQEGKSKGWDVYVTPFYFFDGLIRGDADEFEAHDDNNLILNLYDLGSSSGESYSIFVGVFSIHLLNQGMEWADVKISLGRLGYPENDLVESQKWLINKELIKHLYSGDYQIEREIVQGHWEILKERSYTDNMAVACARKWGYPELVPQTDPQNKDQLIERFNGSLWFIKKIWEHEQLLAKYPKHASGRCGTPDEFTSFKKELNLPCITNYIAKEYLQKMEYTLPSYEKPLAAIKMDPKHYNLNVETLKKIVDDSGKLKPEQTNYNNLL